MTVRFDGSSSARLVRPVLGIAIGTGAFLLLYAAAVPLFTPAFGLQDNWPWVLAGESLLALLPFLGWAVVARRQGGGRVALAGAVLLAVALIGFTALLRQPLGPGDDALLPALLWIAAVVGAAGLTVGSHLRLADATGPGSLSALAATAATVLVGPLLANLALWLLVPADAELAVPPGPFLAWAVVALALGLGAMRRGDAPAATAETVDSGAAAALAALGLLLILIPTAWLSALRPLLLDAAMAAHPEAAGGTPLLSQAIIAGFVAIAVLIGLAALHRGAATLVAAPLAGVLVAWLVGSLDLTAPVSLVWAVGVDIAMALALLAGMHAILGVRADPLRVALAWTAIQVATVAGTRGGLTWWRAEGFVLSGMMRDVAAALALAGAAMLFGIIIRRRRIRR